MEHLRDRHTGHPAGREILTAKLVERPDVAPALRRPGDPHRRGDVRRASTIARPNAAAVNSSDTASVVA